MGGQLTLKQLEQKANQVRQDIISMLVAAGSGHSAGPLDLADIMTALYFDIMNIDPSKPEWPERDVFFLSNGHCVPVQYAVMAERGYFPVEELQTLRKFGSRLQGHPERTKLPGLENTSGPLGSGLSQAAGYAYSLQYLEKVRHRWVYAVTGDGELNEGNIWEAAMFAGKYKLSQLIVFIDRNNIQIDGHNIESVIDAASMARAISNKPSVIIAHTIAGKGVDFMEYDYHWHGNPPGTIEPEGAPPKSDQARVALNKLRTLDGKITSGDIH